MSGQEAAPIEAAEFEPAEFEAEPVGSRSAWLRIVVGVLIAAVLASAYVFAARSYGASIETPPPPADAPPSGVGVVIAPGNVRASDQQVDAYLLLFPDPALVDVEGALTADVVVRITPSVGGGETQFAKGAVPTPQAISLPAPGVEQRYPFDTYALSTTVQAVEVITRTDGAVVAQRDLPVSVDVLFRAPGWGLSDPGVGRPAQSVAVDGTVVRSGSTKTIALMLLLLMVLLATIAVLVAISSSRGRMKLELSVASWTTAMLFALIPIRSFLPGEPPIGSWIDILVFFWVEAVLMVCVLVTATGLLLRASRAHREASAAAD